MNNRWLIYQRERFPLAVHLPLTAIMCLSVLSYSSQLRGAYGSLDYNILIASIVSVISLFFQLRVADEFKDRDIDARYRAHRPVPSGLIQLRELAWLAVLGAFFQLLAALLIDPELIFLLVLLWLYLALMTKEFFAPQWLNAHPGIYLISHMLIMPLVIFYISAFDWFPVNQAMPAGTGWLLVFGFLSGIVAEIGRKIRAPSDERTGVQTYSSVWGLNRAILCWLTAVILLSATALLCSLSRPSVLALGVLSILIIGISTWCSMTFLQHPNSRKSSFLQSLSASSIALLYLGIGPFSALYSP